MKGICISNETRSKSKNGVRILLAAAVGVSVWLAAQQPAMAQSATAQSSVDDAELLAGDLAPDLTSDQEHSVPYREHRVGGRLERVTIIRENGLFTETYQNNRADTIWSAQENELGEVPNMRQWVIGTW